MSDPARQVERRLWHAATWVLATVLPASAAAVVTTWQNAGQDDWFNAANWDTGVPMSADDAYVTNGGTAVIDGASPLAPPALDLVVRRMFVGAGDGGAFAPTGTLLIDGVEFEVFGFGLQVGSASGDNTGASGLLSTIGADVVLSGAPLVAGDTAASTESGITATGNVDIDGHLRAGSVSVVGRSNAGNTGVGDVIVHNGAHLDGLTIASANGGAATGTLTLTGGDLQLGGSLRIGETSFFTPGGDATGVLDVQAGSLRTVATVFGIDLTLGHGVEGTASGTLSTGSVDTSAQPLDDVNIGVGTQDGDGTGSLSLGSGDVDVTGDVEIGHAITVSAGRNDAVGEFDLTGSLNGDGDPNDGFFVGHTSAFLITAGGIGSASGTATVGGVSGFGRIGVGVADGTVFNDTTVSGTLEVGAEGIGGPADALLMVGVANASPNNSTVQGVGAIVEGTLTTAGDVTLPEGTLRIGAVDFIGQATGQVTLTNSTVEVERLSVGEIAHSPVATLPDALLVTADGTLTMHGGSLTVTNPVFGSGSINVGSVIVPDTDVDSIANGTVVLNDVAVVTDGLLSVGRASIFPNTPPDPQTRATGSFTMNGGSLQASGISIGTSFSPAEATGTVVMNGVTAVVDSFVATGLNGSGSGTLTLTDSQLTAGDDLSVAGGTFAVTGNGSVTAMNSALAFENVRVGPGNPAHGTGTITLTDSTLSANGFFRVGQSSNTGTFYGDTFLSLTRSHAVADGSMRLDVGSTTTLAIDGTARGTEYGALTANDLLIGESFGGVTTDTVLSIVFNETPDVDAFDFDLIVTRQPDGIAQDFETVDIVNLDPDFTATTAIVVDDLGMGPVEIYRLSLTRVNFRGCDDNAPANGVAVLCSAFDNVGVTAQPGSGGVSVTVGAGVDVTVAGSAVTLRDDSRLDNAGNLTGAANGVAAVLVAGGGNIVSNAGTIIATGTGSPGVTVQGDGNVIGNSAGARVRSDDAEAVLGGGGTERVENHGTLSGGNGTAVALSAGDDTLLLGPDAVFEGFADGGADTDTFILGGTGNGRFDLATIGAGQAYRGFEQFSKAGASTWTLDGAHGADWHVTDGTLVVEGQLGGVVTVDPGARLGGSGQVGGAVIAGTVAPGSSIGTLDVAGDYTHGAMAVYEVEVDASGAGDRIVATGSATLNGGTVSVLAAPGAYAPSTSYTILTAAGGVTGTFDEVLTNLAFLSGALSYTPNDVLLTLTRNATRYVEVADSFNRRQVAGYLDRTSTSASGDYQDVFDELDTLTDGGARAAFDSLGGEVHGSTQSAMATFGRGFARAMERRAMAPRAAALARAFAEPVLVASLGGAAAPEGGDMGGSAWFAPLGQVGEVNGDGNADGYDYAVGGVAGGVDLAVRDGLRVGAAGGYTHGDLDFDRLGDADVASVHAGLYAMLRWRGVELDAAGSFSWHDVDVERRVSFGALARHARSSYDADQAGVRAELRSSADVFRPFGISLQPFAALAWTSIERDAFRERGAQGIDQVALENTTESLRTTLGVQGARTLALGHGRALTPALRVGWTHEFDEPWGEFSGRFAGAPAGGAFTTRGARGNRDALEARLAVTLTAGERLTLEGSYGATVGARHTDHAFGASLEVSW